jgi:hypothetical protein
MKHVTVAYDKSKWLAVPANNGGNGPAWQWGDELLLGYTGGTALFTEAGHQVDYVNPHISHLARSRDGGETWESWQPESYAGRPGCTAKDAQPLEAELNFLDPGFVMRVEGHGYHGNAGQHWFYSLDRGAAWDGPFSFGRLMEHSELAGQEFTGRTGYVVTDTGDCFIFLSARRSEQKKLGVSLSDKVFLVKTRDGKNFDFLSWVVAPEDPYRAVMPSPVIVSKDSFIVALRRKDEAGSCWIDCYASEDTGRSWRFLSQIGCVYGNRNQCVMIARFSADLGKTWGVEQILRRDFESVNGYADLGYPRLFQRLDDKLVAVYFWCSPAMRETHIEATIFSPPS